MVQECQGESGHNDRIGSRTRLRVHRLQLQHHKPETPPFTSRESLTIRPLNNSPINRIPLQNIILPPNLLMLRPRISSAHQQILAYTTHHRIDLTPRIRSNRLLNGPSTPLATSSKAAALTHSCAIFHPFITLMKDTVREVT